MRKGKNRLLLLYFLISILISVNSFGQTGNIEFDHYSTSSGLSNGYINAIFHDSKGFIWIGTANGLNRFDGITFKTYYYDLNDSATISGSGVTSMAEDSIGNIWVTTSDGLCVYDRKKDNFSRKTIRVNGEKLSNSFNTCFIDSKGFLWVAIANSGVLRFKIYNKHQINNSIIDSEIYLLDEDDVDKVFKNNVYSIIEDENSRIWVVSYSNKLSYFDERQNKFTSQPIIHPEAYKFSNNRKGIIKDCDGDFIK